MYTMDADYSIPEVLASAASPLDLGVQLSPLASAPPHSGSADGSQTHLLSDGSDVLEQQHQDPDLVQRVRREFERTLLEERRALTEDRERERQRMDEEREVERRRMAEEREVERRAFQQQLIQERQRADALLQQRVDEERQRANEERQRAEQRANEERQRAEALLLQRVNEERMRAAQELHAQERRSKQQQRLQQLTAAHGPAFRAPSVDSSGSSSPSVSSVVAPRSPPVLDDARVWAGINPCPAEDDICKAVWDSVVMHRLHEQVSSPAERETKLVHPFINNLLAIISQAAQRQGMECNNSFFEHETSDAGDRAAWLFTQPAEQSHCAINTCFFMETIEGCASATARASVRRGMAQVLQRVAVRELQLRAVGRSATHGIGVIVTASEAKFVRIELSDDSTDLVYPIFATALMPLLGTAEDAACPAGLRLLTRLMLEHDVTRFGLPPTPEFELPEGVVFQRVLGIGGFSTVIECTRGTTSAALKFMHPADDQSRALEYTTMISNEFNILVRLKHAGVPHVPRPVDMIDFSKPHGRGLLMEPIGMPLKEYIKQPGVDRAIVATTLLHQLSKALIAAHRVGIVHLDVRPSNIIVENGAVDTSGLPNCILIDWGLGHDAAAKRARRELHGQDAFMSDKLLAVKKLTDSSAQWEPLPVHDLHALVYTYAVVRNVDGTIPLACAPWAVDLDFLSTIDNVIDERREWMLANLPFAAPLELHCDMRAAWHDVMEPSPAATAVT